MNNLRNHILKSKIYWLYHWFFLFLTLTPLITFLSSSWTGYYDLKLVPVDTYDNVINKLYWYIFVSQQGTWLPISLLLLSGIGFGFFSLTFKPKFDAAKNIYEMMAYSNVINDKEKELLTEVLNLVKENTQLRKKNQNFISELLMKTKTALASRLSAEKPLTPEKAKELMDLITAKLQRETEAKQPLIIPEAPEPIKPKQLDNDPFTMTVV